MRTDHEAQYGSIEETVTETEQLSSFKRTSVVLLLLCGTVAGAGLFMMGQHAAVAGAGSPVEVADVVAEDVPVVEEGAEEVVGKDCPAGTHANAAKFNSECEPCPVGKHKMFEGETMCKECPGGTFRDEFIEADVPCEQCSTGFFATPGSTECKAFTECPSTAGVTVAGTPSSDVRCDNCKYGFNTLSSDYSSPCYKMSDLDGDGLFDRLPPAWEEGMEFDERDAPPSGGEYDPCPFDEYNDKDGDGICDGVPPLPFWKPHLEENSPQFYPKGAWRVDQCPQDPDNNADKDRKCDNRSEDDKVITWDFYANSLAGWTDKQEAFEVNVVDSEVPQLDARRFVFDERVVEVCNKGKDQIEAMFSITRGRYDWTQNDESIIEMYKQLDRLSELRESEKDERWRAQYKEDIKSFQVEIVDAKDKVRFEAHRAKKELHELEKQRDELEDQLEAAEHHALVAGKDDEMFDGETITMIAQALEAKKKEIDHDVALLPPEIAKMAMKNFLPPTCEKLCLDHNLVCTSGKVVYNKKKTERGVTNARDLALDEIQAVREDLAERLKYHEDCGMWYEQARLKKLPRAAELKDELVMVQHEIEDLQGKKKKLENQLSSCSPENQEQDALDNEVREERLEIEYKKVYAKRDALDGALEAAETAVKRSNDDEEKRQSSILLAMIKEEQRENEHAISRLDYAKTGCLDPAEDADEHLQCVCSYDPEPVKEETWSMSTVCTTCFGANKRGVTGQMGTSFKIKKGTVRFALLGEESPTNFVKLTILDKGTALVAGKMPGPRLTEGRPYYQESVSNELPVDAVTGEVGEPQWYPVEWDVTEYLGREAVLQVAHYDKDKMMAVDDFEFFNDQSGCLPSCMAIRDGVCNGGDETCFYFEEDLVPYVQVKSAGHAKGTYCRASFGAGSKLGPGIISMGYDYADWTDNDPTVLPLIEEREKMVMDHDAEKSQFLRDEKQRGQDTDWMMTSSEMKVELGQIDEKWFALILEQDQKITAQRNLRKDMARNMTQTIDELQLEIAEAYADQSFVRGDFDRLMNDPARLDERERDSNNDGVADEPDRLQKLDSKYDADILALKTSRIAKQEELEVLVGEDAGWAGAVLDYLSLRHLPRCMFIEMRGSHYAIALADEGATKWAYEPETSLDNGSVDGTHCVYNTIKPKCVAISKGGMGFVKEMRATCKEEIFTGTCLNQCERFFCSEAYDKDSGNKEDACGKDNGDSPGAFDRCANCCGRLKPNDGWSSCLTRRRRRRLREAVTDAKSAPGFDADRFGDETYLYSKHECAEACLLTEGCMAFDVRKGACIVSTACDATQGEGDGYRTGKWYVKLGTTREEMGMEPHGTPKKKRVRKNRPAPPLGPDFNEIMDQAVIAQGLVDDPMTEGHDMAAVEKGDDTMALGAGMGQDESTFDTYEGERR
jgi:tetratricopeptide (TPR) repeat protein